MKNQRGLGAVLFGLLVIASAPAFAAPDGPSPPPGYLDRSGVGELVFWQGVNGLLAGSVLGYAVTAGQMDRHCRTVNPDGTHSGACKDALGRAGGITVVGLAAGVAIPLLAARGRDLKTADALLVNRATLIGAMHGYIIPFAAGLEPFNTKSVDYVIEVDESRWLAGLTFAGDMAGVGAGSYLAYHFDPKPGTVSFLGTLHTATFIAAMSVGSSFPDEVKQKDLRLISGVSLGLADAALAVGLMYADRIDIGRNRVFWLDTGSMVGWLAGSGLAAIMAGNESRALSIGGALGMVLGTALSYWATDDSEPWRQSAPAEPKLVELDAPGLRMAPRAGQGRFDLSLDLLRGRF